MGDDVDTGSGIVTHFDLELIRLERILEHPQQCPLIRASHGDDLRLAAAALLLRLSIDLIAVALRGRGGRGRGHGRGHRGRDRGRRPREAAG